MTSPAPPCRAFRRACDAPASPARRPRALASLLLATALAGCGTPPAPGPNPEDTRALVLRLLPSALADRGGWAADVTAALSALDLPATPQNLCAVLAVTEQESGYKADPPVPGLGAIAWREIEQRADQVGVPMLALRAALSLSSADGRSYAARIDAATTERQLSEVFEEIVGRIPLGQRLLGSSNPVRTGGPMQVSVAFAERHAADRPYPYPVAGSVRREVFTRRGGLYFGAAHLLAYPAPYADPVFRFADFNAGRWASRNAAFQQALSAASGIALVPDGDLLPPGKDAPAGATASAALAMAGRLGLSESAIRRDLARGDGPGLEDTALHERVFAMAERFRGRALPRAVIPQIALASPKIGAQRRLTTEWFARRVEERHRRCMTRAGGENPG